MSLFLLWYLAGRPRLRANGKVPFLGGEDRVYVSLSDWPANQPQTFAVRLVPPDGPVWILANGVATIVNGEGGPICPMKIVISLVEFLDLAFAPRQMVEWSCPTS